MIFAYLTGINLAAFLAMGWDKRLAMAGRSRIRERTLLALAAAGGSAGAIAAQMAFRHKTRKAPFRTHLWLTPVWQSAAVWAWMRF